MGRAEEAGGADTAVSTARARSSAGAAGADRSWPAAWPLLLFAGFAAIDFAVYRDALHGPFLSDDIGYIVTSPYTRELTADSVAAMFDPFGAASRYTANYAPVHLLLTALERNIFAGKVLGYHLVNVAVHALNSVLLVALLLRSRLPAVAALLGGLLFAVHPANVEAVAWISQLKTNGALALSLGALLALRRHPIPATVLFALALLTKASALLALPMAVAFTWVRGFDSASRRTWRWLGGWAVLFGLYAIPQFGFFGAVGEVEIPAYENPWVHLRSVAGVGTRYLVMAATSFGVSAFHEPEPAFSIVDPWWLAALPLAALLIWRTAAAFRNRSEEAAYWVGAAAAFAPVSQLFPFLNPVADRYLYFILPGLIGGALFLVVDLRDRLEAGVWLSRGVAVAVAGLAAFFAVHSAERAKLWTNDTFLYLDAARHYPQGGTAAFLSARRAARQGDTAAAVAALRKAADRGIDRFMVLRDDPGLVSIRDTEEFRALLYEMAGHWIERASQRENPAPPELRVMAHAHLVRGEYAEAEALLERALGAGGPLTSVVRAELAALRASAAELPRRGGEDGTEKGEGHRPEEP
jgi:tetratricopeptide (TPR) repeat protein